MTMQTMQRYTEEEVRAAVERLPRVPLANTPTPLEDCPRLAAAIGVRRLLVKRDDLTGLAFGGNKTRLLEFRLADALGQGADVLVLGVEVQSNSARQTAAAGNKLGLKTVLLLRGRPPAEVQGNLLVDELLGAEIHFVAAPDNAAFDRALTERAAALVAEGRRPYVVNHAPIFAVASAVAYVVCTLEIVAQLRALGERADHVYMSSGSKGHAGLMVAAKALGLATRVTCIAASRDPGNRRELTATTANRAAAALGLDLAFEPDEVNTDDGYVGPGYGVPSADGLAALALAARTEGMILDPTYTAKVLAGLADHVRRGLVSPDHAVVFVHTGGQPAVFAHAAAIRAHLAD